MKKKIVAIAFAAVLSIANIMSVFAAEEIFSKSGPLDASEVEPSGTQNEQEVDQFIAKNRFPNPFAGKDTSNGVTIQMEISDVQKVTMLGGVFGFTDDNYTRLFFLTGGSYLGFNNGIKYIDANMRNYTLVKDYIGAGGLLTVCVDKTGFWVYIDDVLCYDNSILATDDGASGAPGSTTETLTDFTEVLTFLKNDATTLSIGGGTFWRGLTYDEVLATVSDIKCSLGVVKPGAPADGGANVQKPTSSTTNSGEEEAELSAVVIAVFVVAVVVIIGTAAIAIVLKKKKSDY